MKYIMVFVVCFFFNSNCYSQNNDTNSIENEEISDSIKKKKGKLLEEVVISSTSQKNIPSAGKTNIKPINLPQSTVIIGKETIEQQQILRLSEVLKNANGVYVSGASNAAGNNQEEIGARGFTFNGNNTFKNGVRFNNSIIPETSSLENIEILKGSSALLYGNVAPGGILNLVTKKPKFTNGGEVNFRTSEYNLYKPTIDVYGSINDSKKLAFRLITSLEKGNSYRSVVNNERFYINPSLLFEFTDNTSLLIEGDYLKDTRTPDFGLTTIDYNIVVQRIILKTNGN
jgi:iron complex outermembrane recepter protein